MGGWRGYAVQQVKSEDHLLRSWRDIPICFASFS
jgi:hypothetical protein